MSTTIAVLMGGPSAERDISLQTGKAMLTACEKLGYDTTPVTFSNNIVDYLYTLQKVDLVLIALHGGIGENGQIQGLFESLGIRYTGSNALSSAICMDKHISKLLVEDVGIDTPKWEYLRIENRIENKFGYPCVVKPNSEGSTFGVTIVENERAFKPAVNGAFEFGDEIIIEEYIEGRELTVAVIADEVYPIIEIKPEHGLYDYECKYTKGLSDYICPADLDHELTDMIQETSLKIYKLLKCCHYGRVDFRLDRQDRFWFLELNTLPGMMDTSLVPKAAKAVYMSFEQLIDKIIKLALGN